MAGGFHRSQSRIHTITVEAMTSDPAKAYRIPEQAYEKDKEKELFEQLHRTIVEQQLFLDPLFARKTYIRLGPMNKNKAARLIRKFTGTNLNGYINGLRLEHVAKLLAEYPDVPMKAVAADSGFNSICTFFRAFRARYGMTPSQYRKKL